MAKARRRKKRRSTKRKGGTVTKASLKSITKALDNAVKRLKTKL